MGEGWERKARAYLDTLCGVKPNRRTGSPGNREATEFVARTVKPWGYTIDTTPFACLDYERGESSLLSQRQSFEIQVSPFSPACDATSRLETVSTIDELERCVCRGKILLMRGALCAEQLMPKNFIFYNPDHHKKIYTLLEEKQPAAIVTATGRMPELVGALYPFPLICDGDFDIPSVYCKDTVGEKIAARTGEAFRLRINARRIPATACNVIIRKNPDALEKIVVCAHIDAYENAPGASDDASGIVVELVLAEMLKDYRGPSGIEIIAFNGEDYYSAGGQMDYLRRYGQGIDSIAVAVNIDDIGYVRGRSAYSLYECPEGIQVCADRAFGPYGGIVKGVQWYQGDHMVFVQNGRPAIAFTSENMHELMASITHTAADTPEIVDCGKLYEVARALEGFITSFPAPA
ncbi:MAG: M28 family peptidase [bacterium]